MAHGKSGTDYHGSSQWRSDDTCKGWGLRYHDREVSGRERAEMGEGECGREWEGEERRWREREGEGEGGGGGGRGRGRGREREGEEGIE